MEQSDWTSLAKREAAYIRQLKNEIIHVLQLTRERDPGLHQPQLSHVKNMQSMREIQNSNSSNSSRDSILAQLQRYNFSSDPTQVMNIPSLACKYSISGFNHILLLILAGSQQD